MSADALKPLTRRELDAQTCDTPGCDHSTHDGDGLYLTGRCHAGAPTQVLYRDGTLTLRCYVCRADIVYIAVAAG
jgi:hypothetical protein